MLRNALAVSAAVLLIGAVLAQNPYQPKPIPAGPEAYSEDRLREDRTKFWTNLLLAECAARPGYKPEWKPHLEVVLGGLARWWLQQTLDAGPIDAMRRGNARLWELDCDEPLCSLASAYDDLAHGLHDAAASWRRQTAPALRERLKSPALRFLLEHTCLQIAMFAERAADGAMISAVDTCLQELLRSPEFGPGSERHQLNALEASFPPDPQSLPRLEALEKAVGKPCYALLIHRAQTENSLAWAARGQGAASTIGESDGARFEQHLVASIEAATKAFELCPQHPEAPVAMMQILGVIGRSDELRVWFDRAVAAQLDFEPAYRIYLHYQQPRWGGSVRSLQKFGEECLATGRFDTFVPTCYVVAMQYVAMDLRKPLSVWQRDAVQKKLEELEKGCAAAAKTNQQHRVAATHRVLRLALGGQVEAAATEFERQKESLDPNTLRLYDLKPEWLQKALRPHMVSYVPATIPAQDLFRGHDTAAYPGVDKAVPLASHVRAPTSAQIKTRAAKWFARSYVAAYDRFGTHDPAWDDDARALLARFAEVVNGEVSEPMRVLTGKVLAADCTDPLVLYATTRTQADETANRRFRRMTKADAGLDKTYTPAFQWFAKQELWQLAREVGRLDVTAEALPGMRDRMARGAADPIFAGDDRCQFVRCIHGPEQWIYPGTAWVDDDVVAAMAKVDGADPWIVHVVTGLHLARLARHVASEDRKLAEQLQAARSHLEKAYALHPELPEAAVGMIVVSALLRDEAAPSPREWLDRALAGHIDCEPALRLFVDTLRPANGGSVAAMYRFAVECLQSARYDTELPLWYVRTLQRIAEEVEEPRSVWAATGVGQSLERMFAGYLTKGDVRYSAGYFHSGRCLTAWAGGRYADAVGARKDIAGGIDSAWLQVVGIEDLELVEIDLKAAGRPR
jgi:hypothetical protein